MEDINTIKSHVDPVGERGESGEPLIITIPNPLYPMFSKREFTLMSDYKIVATEDEVNKAISHLLGNGSIYHDYAMSLMSVFSLFAKKHPERFKKGNEVVAICCESCLVNDTQRTFRLWAEIRAIDEDGL